MTTRDEIYAGTDLTDTEIGVAKDHLHKLMAETGKLRGCTSYVQRKMMIGYNHAARILEALEGERFISPADQVGERHFIP